MARLTGYPEAHIRVIYRVIFIHKRARRATSKVERAFIVPMGAGELTRPVSDLPSCFLLEVLDLSLVGAS